MTYQNSLLIDLLNDTTFVAWVKGDKKLPGSEKDKWNQWLEENPDHSKIVQHARRVLDMPFKEVEIGCISSGELDRLLEALEKEDSGNKII